MLSEARYLNAAPTRIFAPRITLITHPSVVLPQVMSKGYLKMQDNFLNFLGETTPHMKQKLFLLCMDHESVTFMSNLGVRCVEIDRSIPSKENERKTVWVVRMKVREEERHLSILAQRLWSIPVDGSRNRGELQCVQGSSLQAALSFVLLDVFEDAAICHVEMSSTMIQCHMQRLLDVISLSLMVSITYTTKFLFSDRNCNT